MNSRERVLAAADCKPPDRIPIDFWAVNEVFNRLIKELSLADVEDVMQKFDADLRFFRGPGMGQVEPDADGIFADHWGVKRQWHKVTGKRKDGAPYTWTYKHMVESPLGGAQSVTDIEKHVWPDPSQWDYSGVKDACKTIHDAGYAVVFGGDRQIGRAHV